MVQRAPGKVVEVDVQFLDNPSRFAKASIMGGAKSRWYTGQLSSLWVIVA